MTAQPTPPVPDEELLSLIKEKIDKYFDCNLALNGFLMRELDSVLRDRTRPVAGEAQNHFEQDLKMVAQPQNSEDELTPDQHLRFNVLVPLVSDITIKRQEERGLLKMSDESPYYGKAIVAIQSYADKQTALFAQAVLRRWGKPTCKAFVEQWAQPPKGKEG